jgi:uncharacterized protein
MECMTQRLGLHHCPAFYRDRCFLAAVLAGGIFWFGLWAAMPLQPVALQHVASWGFWSLVLWQPCWEEFFFRGLLQGYCRQQPWGRRTWGGITAANGVTSLLFMAGHWWHHPPLWATAVLVPSLLFGYYRDRFTSVYPSIVLHVWYNAGYFILTGIP